MADRKKSLSIPFNNLNQESMEDDIRMILSHALPYPEISKKDFDLAVNGMIDYIHERIKIQEDFKKASKSLFEILGKPRVIPNETP